MDLVAFKHTDYDHYTVAIYFSNDGKTITKQVYTFACHNDELQSDKLSDKTVAVQCDESDNCYMVVDTPLFTAKLVKVIRDN